MAAAPAARCKYCESFTGDAAAVAAHEQTCVYRAAMRRGTISQQQQIRTQEGAAAAAAAKDAFKDAMLSAKDNEIKQLKATVRTQEGAAAAAAAKDAFKDAMLSAKDNEIACLKASKDTVRREKDAMIARLQAQLAALEAVEHPSRVVEQRKIEHRASISGLRSGALDPRVLSAKLDMDDIDALD